MDLLALYRPTPHLPRMSDPVTHLNAALEGRYRIESELGEGGMGTVYLAEDLKHHRHVALKVLHRGLAPSMGGSRFLREIEIAARLAHPHIVPVHDSGEANGVLYYVMPVVEGESLRDLIRASGALPVERAVSIARDVADGLDHAHQQGVVHRDIKPSNILLTGRNAVIVDFGVARAIEATGAQTLTESGMAVGTAIYMSPEQVSESHRVDGRSDIYSLGCVLYEMLTGRPPFKGGTLAATFAGHLLGEVPPFEETGPQVPPAIQGIVMRALEKAPDDRFQTAPELISALGEEALPSSSWSVGGFRGPARRRRRRIGVVASAAVGVAALVVFGVAQVLTDPASIDLDAGQGVVVVLPYHDPISTPEEKALLVELAGELTRQLNRWESMRAVPVVALPGAMFDLGVEGPTLGRVDEGLEVASRLGVETLVTLNGRLRRDSLTLTASLFDVSSGRELGRPLESSGAAADLFPLAATIVHAMLGLEGPVAEVEELRRQSSHPGALQDYARGIQLLERWRLEDAEASLRSATALDTAFAMAHHYLALTLHLRSSEVVERQSILGPEAGRSAIAALRHSVGLPTRDSLHVLAFHRFQEGDYEEARSIYRDLIGGDSTDVYAWLLGGIVEFTDPWLDENPDGFLAPRADWNTVVRAFSETVRLSPGFHLGYGYLLDITWQGRRDDLLIGAPLALPEGRLRTGIHFGLVARRRDGDLFGDAVNVASRLGGIAEPGQIVLSQTAGDQLGDEIELDDLGERTLKNVPDVRCWAIPINTPSTKLGTHPHQTQSQESGDR